MFCVEGEGGMRGGSRDEKRGREERQEASKAKLSKADAGRQCLLILIVLSIRRVEGECRNGMNEKLKTSGYFYIIPIHQTPWFPRGLHAHTHTPLFYHRQTHTRYTTSWSHHLIITRAMRRPNSCPSRLERFIFADGEV